ncbi:SCO family protein [Oceanobacillus alkalisoli]|uniref:SCO family protein n=1 Tax=Oceanobacillus alkalisoli TaxID=2925113 RepID=UPI001F11DF01|nr:SCO family protein [Oceanobacillus alkalisoli]MCF3943040.1 SCO family protein [Oceanobacillus alkalisoli]
MKKLFAVLIFCAVVLLAACGEEIEPNMEGEVADFSFTTQANETLSLDDLRGEWWIADFIFTNCTTVCLPMTTNMADLQSKLKEEDLDVQLVSFSVDPDYDSPEVLIEYAKEYDADFSNWSFLTGYDFETIKELSMNSFRSVVEQAAPGDDQVTHGTSFFLVNPDGEIIKRYSGVDNNEMDLIVEDLRLVLN